MLKAEIRSEAPVTIPRARDAASAAGRSSFIQDYLRSFSTMSRSQVDLHEVSLPTRASCAAAQLTLLKNTAAMLPAVMPMASKAASASDCS